MKLLKNKQSLTGFAGKNTFLYFLMLSFVFVSTSAMAISGQISIQPINNLTDQTSKSFAPIPIAKENSSFPILSAQAALAVDMTTGITLYEKNPDEMLLPASTTKIITALVALETYQLNQVLRVGNLKVDGQKMGLTFGEEMKVEDLLYGLLVYSANDAAYVLAQNYPGGYDAFILAMNNKAKELSMNNSHFYNPAGLDGTSQLTTARDLIRASEVAMRNPEFAKIVGTREIIVKDIAGKKVHKLANINELLGKVPGVLGVKTGWTENARENLVTYIERDGRNITIVVLGSQSRFSETKELIDWIFENYDWKPVNYSP